MPFSIPTVLPKIRKIHVDSAVLTHQPSFDLCHRRVHPTVLRPFCAQVLLLGKGESGLRKKADSNDREWKQNNPSALIGDRLLTLPRNGGSALFLFCPCCQRPAVMSMAGNGIVFRDGRDRVRSISR
jgi:hypothetical protein